MKWRGSSRFSVVRPHGHSCRAPRLNKLALGALAWA
jgi:hypothetical protein